MQYQEIEQHSIKIKRQATYLLESTGLINILNKYGKSTVIGSYPLDIMYGPDIDIIVESSDIRKASVDALNEIVKASLFQKLEYGDFVKFPREKRHNGYIIVLKALVENIKWEIEIWFLSDVKDQLEQFNYLKDHLNSDNRKKILEAKHLRATSDISKHNLRSFEIYKQILNFKFD